MEEPPAVNSISLFMYLTDSNWVRLSNPSPVAEGDYIYAYIGFNPSSPSSFVLQVFMLLKKSFQNYFLSTFFIYRILKNFKNLKLFFKESNLIFIIF